jgi:Ala-tRNA(Pro) deacylase
VYVDALLAENETIYFQVGTHTETMSLKYTDFERLGRPTIGEFTYEETAVYHMG